MGKSPEFLNDAIRLIDTWLEYQQFFLQIPAISVGIVHDKQIIFTKHLGYADIASKKKPTDDTCYRVASISKIFTTIAVMQLVEQGKLRLDDKVSKILPWFKNNDKRTEEITVRQILFHGSGLKRDGDTDHWVSYNFPDLETVKKCIQDNPIIFGSNEKWKYSNLAFGILGEIIAVSSGMSYDDYVTNNIVQKLGLKCTGPRLTEDQHKVLATPYGRLIPGQEREVFKQHETGALAAATGFTSNVPDLCKFISAQFDGDNTLISDASKKEMRRTQWVIKDDKEEWGVGYQIMTSPKDPNIYGHSGGFFGFITCIGYVPEEKLGVVVLTNAQDGPAVIFLRNIFHAMLNIKNQYNSLKKLNTKRKLDEYECRFMGRWGEMAVSKINQSLVIHSPTSRPPLQNLMKLDHVKDDTFVISEGSGFGTLGEQVIFTFSPSGEIQSVKMGPNPWEIRKSLP